MTVDGRDAVFLQGQAVVDRLAHGLHAEQVTGVTNAEALSVDRADRDAKLLRIDPLELRNVVGHGAPVIRPHTVVHVLAISPCRRAKSGTARSPRRARAISASLASQTAVNCCIVSPPPSWPSASGSSATISRTRGSSEPIPAVRILVINSINEIRCWASVLKVRAMELTPPDCSAQPAPLPASPPVGCAARAIAARLDTTIT